MRTEPTETARSGPRLSRPFVHCALRVNAPSSFGPCWDINSGIRDRRSYTKTSWGSECCGALERICRKIRLMESNATSRYLKKNDV
jgi:hypothetical protein